MKFTLNQYNIENIIWDWNGTLLDDVLLCVDIANELIANHDVDKLNVETYKNVFGFPVTDYYKKIGIDFEKESFEELTKKFIKAYDGGVRDCKLHDNVKDILSQFEKKRINQHILTAAHKESVINLLDYYSITKYFNKVEGLDNYKAESKIDIGIKLIENNKINKKTTVLIGDTIHDYEVSAKLGINCILIAKGHQSKKRLVENTNNSTIVIDEINKLKNMF